MADQVGTRGVVEEGEGKESPGPLMVALVLLALALLLAIVQAGPPAATES